MFSQTNKKFAIYVFDFLFRTQILTNVFCSLFISSFRSIFCVILRRSATGYASSPLNSRHGSQESLRHLSSMSSMNMLQTPTGTRDVGGAQKKKGIKSSLGRFFSKKEKVIQYFVSFVTWLIHSCS